VTQRIAALFESLIQNHPFLDGNKGTTLAAAHIRLRMHGIELGGDSLEHHEVIITLMREATSIGRESTPGFAGT
jgi:death-on-curing protein